MPETFALRALALLQGFLALAAADGGVGLIIGARGFLLPVEWLAPVETMGRLVPGLLLILIGVVFGWGARLAWFDDRKAPLPAFAGAAVLTGWLGMDIAVPGAPISAYWTTAGCAVVLASLAIIVSRREDVKR